MLGSVVAIFAAVSAARSATAAKDAIAQAARAERQRHERELARIANQVVALTMSVDTLGDDLRLSWQTEAAFANRNPNPFAAHEADLANHRAASHTMQTAARELLDRRAQWGGHTDDELTALLITMEGHVVQLERLRGKLVRDLESSETDNRISRQHNRQ